MSTSKKEKSLGKKETKVPLLNADDHFDYGDEKEDPLKGTIFKKNPLESSNWLSKLFFSWVTDLTLVRPSLQELRNVEVCCDILNLILSIHNCSKN